MSRLFWLGLGAAVGVMVTRRVNRAARHLMPGGMAEDLGDALRELAGAVGSFGADVRAGMAERERELHRMVDERTGISVGGSVDGGGFGGGFDSGSDSGSGGGSDGGSDGTVRRDGAGPVAARARHAAD
jgi:hypothetical protein